MGEKEAKKPPTLDEKLLETCKNDCKYKYVLDLLEQGANAAYEFYDPGVWGARQRRCPIHMAIKSVGYKMEPDKIAEATKVIQLLLERGAKPNSLYEDYNWKGGGESTTAFQMALPLAMKNPPLLSLFLSHGADPNLPLRSEAHTMRYDGSQKWTPLHSAVESSNAEVVKLLLDAGAKVDALRTHRGQSEYGSAENTEETPLHMACYGKKGKNPEIVRMLIEKGANVNAVRRFLENVHVERTQTVTDPRDDGYVSNVELYPVFETPVHIAVMKKSPEVVSMLVNAGADLSITYKRGKVVKTVWELCEDDEMRRALNHIWTPEKHRTFPKPVKDAIYNVLLIAKKLAWPLDKAILHRIFGFVAYGWIPERPEPPPESPKKESPNLFDEDDDALLDEMADEDIFASAVPSNQAPSQKAPEKSIFDDPFVSAPSNQAPSKKAPAKSIFDDSDEDDLFATKSSAKDESKNTNPAPKPASSSLFEEDDEEEEEDLFDD